MLSMRPLLILICLFALLIGCGQKGNLYLPDDIASQEQSNKAKKAKQ
jgi:predicted small lipoprotein YifL